MRPLHPFSCFSLQLLIGIQLVVCSTEKKASAKGIKGKNGLRVLTSATLCLKKESIYLDEPSYDEVVLS